MPRSSWKGYLKLSLVSVPVKGYTASKATSEIRLYQLHSECHSRIKYQKVCPIHGEVRVRIGAHDDEALLVVADQGPGVPAAERARLGQRFHRLQPGETTGSGLGLSIVKRIAALHGATVAFDAIPEGGLAVTVSFPRPGPMAQ